ncbi:SoxR reducing system RseC family protein [Methylophaga sp.]|uniref:SoxR reducing system RseC family protein n=1 Tax=Methylophaga sp. TaxID=2024840 RepID=UPI0027259C5C|nr:SoxR reducing system RseC family protein [Methylophaga sp.]MDO8828075.1 SoxR reducing system RseC family protein [Methylophaga sp.]
MIEQQVKVKRVDGNRITVESLQTSACEQCAQKSSCASSLYTKLLPRRQMQLSSTIPVNVGDTVVISISETGVLRASILLYLLPIIIMLIIVGLYDASSAETNETIAALLAFGSLAVCLYLIHRIQAYFIHFFMAAPTLLRKD